MNWRYLYIGSVIALSYILFLSWNAEKEIKQEVAEATAIDQNINQLLLPLGEDDGFVHHHGQDSVCSKTGSTSCSRKRDAYARVLLQIFAQVRICSSAIYHFVQLG